MSTYHILHEFRPDRLILCIVIFLVLQPRYRHNIAWFVLTVFKQSDFGPQACMQEFLWIFTRNMYIHMYFILLTISELTVPGIARM